MSDRVVCLVNDCVPMDRGFFGEHGVSFFVEKGETRLLFDTSETFSILANNCEKLEIDLSSISFLALSHGHYDHTGAIEKVLQELTRPVVFGDPLVFQPKIMKRENGSTKQIGSPLMKTQVSQLAELHLTETLTHIGDGIYLSGRIPRNTTYEQTPQNIYIESSEGQIVDSLLDDRSLIVDMESYVVLICGCCHAGIINTLQYIDSKFKKPVRSIFGGIHLNGASKERIEQTIAELKDVYNPELMYFNHCTGFNALSALRYEFGEKLIPCPVGTEVLF